MSTLKIAQSVIESISALADVDPAVYECILELSVRAMEGRLDNNEVTIIMGNFENISPNEIIKIIHAAADLYWEFARSVIKNEIVVLTDILNQVGLPESLISPVVKVYIDNKARISQLKRMFHLSYPRFQDFSWRIDVELARRNMNVMTEPKFMLRLDLLNTSSSSSSNTASQEINHSYNIPVIDHSSSKTNSNSNVDDCNNSDTMTSYHLQSDYANMKRLETKLKEALDEFDSIQSQRIVRYIS